MPKRARKHIYSFLHWSEKYTKTDMVYLFSSGFWSNANVAFISVASFLLYIVFAHFVPKEVYGTYQYLLSIAAIATAFTLTGMNAAVTRAVARGFDGTFVRSVAMQMRYAIIPLIGGIVLGSYYLFTGSSTLGLGIIIIGIFVPINGALNTYTAVLWGKRNFKRSFIYSMWWNIPYYGIVALVAIFFHAALVLIAANLITQAIGLYVVYKKTKTHFIENDAVSPETLPYGMHLSVMNVLAMIAAQADTVLAFHFLGAIELAIYAFASTIPDHILLLFKFIQSAALPKFAKKTPKEIRPTFARRIILGTVLAGVAMLIYIAIAHLFYGIFFNSYLVAVPISRIYALIVLSAMSGVVTNALIAAGNVKRLYQFNIIAPLVQIALMTYGIITFGIVGLILGKVISSFFTLLLAVYLYWRLKE